MNTTTAPTHPMQAGSQATARWLAAALVSTASLTVSLIAITDAAAGVWTASLVGLTLLVALALLTASALLWVRRELSKQAWSYVTNERRRPHPADVILDSVHGLMIIAISWAILTYDTPTPARAALVITGLGVGLTTIVLWRLTGQLLNKLMSRQTALRWFLRDLQHLIAANIILGLALYRTPEMVASIPAFVALFVIGLIFVGAAAPMESMPSLNQLNPTLRKAAQRLRLARTPGDAPDATGGTR